MTMILLLLLKKGYGRYLSNNNNKNSLQKSKHGRSFLNVNQSHEPGLNKRMWTSIVEEDFLIVKGIIIIILII